jgi:hypothetical protein
MDIEIYRKGFNSFFTGDGYLNNPYPSSSDEYNWFERGWTQALKRSDNTAARNKSSAFIDKSFQGKYSEANERTKIQYYCR